MIDFNTKSSDLILNNLEVGQLLQETVFHLYKGHGKKNIFIRIHNMKTY